MATIRLPGRRLYLAGILCFALFIYLHSLTVPIKYFFPNRTYSGVENRGGSPRLAKPENITITAIVFFGRSDRVRSLNCYIQRNLATNGGWLDEVIWAVATEEETDLAFLEEILTTSPSYRSLDLGGRAVYGYRNIWEHMENGKMYVKIDDDVVNKDMLSKANQNRDKAGAKASNVTVVEAPITDIHPLDGGSVDCVISNCVVNLVPEEHKRLVFREMFRLLKPGRRVAISDILIKDGMELPKDVHSNMALLVGCIAGASHLSAYEKYLREAGFNSILIADNHKDLNVYKTDAADEAEGKSCCGTSVPASEGTAVTSKSCCGVSAPASASATASKSCCGTSARSAQSNGAIAYTVDLSDFDFNTYAGSSNIYAVKA